MKSIDPLHDAVRAVLEGKAPSIDEGAAELDKNVALFRGVFEKLKRRKILFFQALYRFLLEQHEWTSDASLKTEKDWKDSASALARVFPVLKSVDEETIEEARISSAASVFIKFIEDNSGNRLVIAKAFDDIADAADKIEKEQAGGIGGLSVSETRWKGTGKILRKAASAFK